jgi:hypothetical protein
VEWAPFSKKSKARAMRFRRGDLSRQEKLLA